MRTVTLLAGAALALAMTAPSLSAPSLSAPAPAAGDAAATLAAARHAYGPVRWRRLGVLVETGSESAAGLNGTFRLAVDLRDGRMHAASDFGVLKGAEVWDGANHWRQDHSGGVHALNSAFMRANNATQLWLARLGYLRPHAGGADIAYLGTQAEDGRSYDRLRATPPDGQPVELWFDRATGLLARSIWQMPISTRTFRYDDYRRAGGVLMPFRTAEDEDGQNPDITQVAQVEAVKTPLPGEFAPPQTPDDFTIAGGAATVPITFDHDVIVDATINGKGPYSFILDTGGHDILTTETAKALGLSGQGGAQSGGAGAGTVTEQYTNVDRVDIGGVSLRNQAFFIIPMQYGTVERGAKPPLAGILGLELFERFAMELNYRAQTLTFRPLKGAPEGHGVAVPITFSDDSPLFPGKIDGIAGDIALDTGNSGTLVIQGRWADANGLTEALKKGGLQSAGFGMGGMSHNVSTYADFEVAGVTLSHIGATYENDPKGAFSSRTEAGNAGNDILANFTLSFDYARNIIWFDPVPGHEMPQRGRSGLAVYKQAPDAMIVVVVVPNSPAAEAGLAVGDRITAIDGVPASQLAGWDVWRLSRGKPGTALKIDYLHGDEKHTATLTLRDL